MARLAAWRRVIVFSKACWLECQGLCSPCHGVRVWVCIARPLTISNLFAVGTTTFACLSCISKLVWSGRVFRSIYPVSNNLKVTHTLCAFNLCSLSSFISSPRLFLAENGDWLVFLSIVSQRVHLRSMLASDFQCELHSLLLAWCPVAGKSKSSGLLYVCTDQEKSSCSAKHFLGSNFQWISLELIFIWTESDLVCRFDLWHKQN